LKALKNEKRNENVDRKEIRRIERHWRRQNKKEKDMSLKGHLQKILPAGMMPGNVGHINQVMWPFFHVITIDFGTNPTYGPSTRQAQSFQVTQEACLLLSKITRKSYSYNDAGELAPLQLTMRDRQSSRQLNDRPIPLQMLGKKSFPSILPTPYLIMPNGFFEVEVTSWLTANQVTVGNGKHEFIFEGYRIRIEDQDKVLSTIFG
jgi:hypothetical protein